MRPPPGFVSSSQQPPALLPMNQQRQAQAQILMHPRSHHDVTTGNNNNNNDNTNNSNGNDNKGMRVLHKDSTYRLPIKNEAARSTSVRNNLTHLQLRQQRHQHSPQHQQQQQQPQNHHQHHSSAIRMKKNIHLSSNLHHPSQTSPQLQNIQQQQQQQHDNADIMDQLSLNSRGVPCTIYVNVDEDAVSNSEDTLTVCADSVTESSLVGMIHPNSHPMPPIKNGSAVLGAGGGAGAGGVGAVSAMRYVENSSERRMGVLEETAGVVDSAAEVRFTLLFVYWFDRAGFMV